MLSNPVLLASRIGSSILRNGANRIGTIAGTCFLACLLGGVGSLCAQSDAPPLTAAASLFSEDTQAMFVLPDSERFLEHWNRTELGKLASDAILKNFWETQRQEIEDRFKAAGWQLNLQIEDVGEISGGQTSLAWISRPQVAAKPFSIAMVVDIAGRVAPTEKLLNRIDGQLKAQGATSKSLDVAGAKVVQYVLPKIAGESRQRESFYTMSKDQLLATDDLLSITELIEAQKGSKKDSLAQSPLYQQVQKKIPHEGNPPEIEYFVRPIGFAKLLRSISGKPSTNEADILKILDGQGFGEIQCVAGNVQVATDSFDFFHNGYTIVQKPSSPSVQILDFPNLDSLEPPDWINKDTASVLSFSWNLKEAFPRFQGIVDAYVGAGTFSEVLKGISLDPNGPQIDIAKEVLPYISTEFHFVTEIIKPIAPDSKRSMVILKLNDPNKKLGRVMERFGKSEPDAKAFDFEGYRIWRKKVEDVEMEIEFNKDAGDDEDEEADEPLLDEWAITIMDEYFIFASNADMITDTIRNAKNGNQKGAFAKEADVQRVTEALKTLNGGNPLSFSRITRSDLAFEMQYELFRQNNLAQSQSMLAHILDRVLKPKGRKDQPQKVQGNALPPFAQVRNFFKPSGGVIRTDEEGWSFKTFILSK